VLPQLPNNNQHRPVNASAPSDAQAVFYSQELEAIAVDQVMAQCSELPAATADEAFGEGC
jgi:hypothetical protein